MAKAQHADIAMKHGGLSPPPYVVPTANNAPFIPISCRWRLHNGFGSAHLPEGAALPDEISNDHLNVQSVGAGCSLFHMNSQPAQLVIRECTFTHERPVLTFLAQLKGSSRFRVSGSTEIGVTPEHYVIQLTNPGSVAITEQAVESEEVVSFMLSEDRLRQMLEGMRVPTQIEKILKGRCNDFQLAPRISFATRRLFTALCSTSYTGSWAQFYLNAKIFELFYEVFRDLDDGTGSRSLGIGNDRDKVDLVRDILLDDLGNPPTVEMLAQQVGLSQRQLSEAFRATTGMTVLEWVLEQKLLLARQLLMEGALPLKEISFRTGYAHRSSFTEAFAKRFGVSPSQYRSSAG